MNTNLLDFRVLAFATHGLLPGDIPGFDKPGLAMTFEGIRPDDSILSIDDVANLRLNAQWVLLSACNSGYNTGSERESVSALSRAFFAAGAKTLLATAWAVESNSARTLTVDTFGRFASEARLSKAQAFAQAQREMLGGKHGDLFRHPYFWGAYYVVGDAER